MSVLNKNRVENDDCFFTLLTIGHIQEILETSSTDIWIKKLSKEL